MKRHLAPLWCLWILFGLVALISVALAFALLFLGPQMRRVEITTTSATDRIPAIRQKIEAEQDRETLRKQALVLLDSTNIQARTVESMEEDSVNSFESICVVFFVVTVWSGTCAYQLQRQLSRTPSSPPA